MTTWVRLAKATLEIEWPSYEAIRSFSVWQLQPRLSGEAVRKDLTKLAHVFGEPQAAPSLIRSYQDCEYTASKKRALDQVIDNFH